VIYNSFKASIGVCASLFVVRSLSEQGRKHRAKKLHFVREVSIGVDCADSAAFETIFQELLGDFLNAHRKLSKLLGFLNLP
jgi:hypothetical protein